MPGDSPDVQGQLPDLNILVAIYQANCLDIMHWSILNLTVPVHADVASEIKQPFTDRDLQKIVPWLGAGT